jgi:hypothetical protein
LISRSSICICERSSDTRAEKLRSCPFGSLDPLCCWWRARNPSASGFLRAYDEQIYRSDPIRMIAKESLPTLRRWFSSLDHILGHTRLPDFDAELEQLSVEPRRSPQRISNAHVADKLAYLRRDSWSATTTSRLPAPIRSETRAMPTDDCIRLDDRQRIAPALMLGSKFVLSCGSTSVSVNTALFSIRRPCTLPHNIRHTGEADVIRHHDSSGASAGHV